MFREEKLLDYVGVCLLLCSSATAAAAAVDNTEEDSLGSSSLSSAWIGTVISAVAGLALGSLTVAVLAFNPGEPNRRRSKSKNSKHGGDECACCH